MSSKIPEVRKDIRKYIVVIGQPSHGTGNMYRNFVKFGHAVFEISERAYIQTW